MATITPESVKELQKIYREEHGKELTDEEAWEAAHNLVNFFDLLMTIDKRQQNQKSE